MLRVFSTEEQEAEKKERIIIYGAPGVGKSRLALSLTKRFGKILYYAADNNSEFLDSISREKAKNVIVIKSDGDGPIENFSEFALHDWKSEFSDVGTLVVDTYTTVMQQAIMESANKGLAGTKPHFRVGNVGRGGQAIPTWDDYLGTEGLSRSSITDMFKEQKDFHIIFVCHEDVKQVEGMPAAGGPSHPGRKMLVDMPGMFSTVIRVIKDRVLIPGDEAATDVVIAVTDHDGRFIAKARTQEEGAPSPLGRVALDRNPINFWQQYDAIYAPEAQKEQSNG